MNTYDLISADFAAKLGIKRATLALLSASVCANVLLAAGILLKEDSVSTVLIPVGMNELTHPVTVSEARVDQDYLMLVARDLLSLAMNVTPANADFNRETLLKHVAPSSFGEIDETLKTRAQKIQRLRASTLFAVESMDVDCHNLTVKATGVLSHFIGKTETRRQKTTVAMRFTLTAGKLQLVSLTDNASDDSSDIKQS